MSWSVLFLRLHHLDMCFSLGWTPPYAVESSLGLKQKMFQNHLGRMFFGRPTQKDEVQTLHVELTWQWNILGDTFGSLLRTPLLRSSPPRLSPPSLKLSPTWPYHPLSLSLSTIPLGAIVFQIGSLWRTLQRRYDSECSPWFGQRAEIGCDR